MRKCLNIALIYASAALLAGVFYREFTKYKAFGGVTALGKVHTHLFVLGMLMFLVLGLFAEQIPLWKQKNIKAFMFSYNLGVSWTALLLVARGVLQVQGTALSKAANAALSGLAGLGHIFTAVGLILLLIALRRAEQNKRTILSGQG